MNLAKIVVQDSNRYFIDGKESTHYAVAQNYYYFLGNNREVSKDSRFFGYAPERMIVGKSGITPAVGLGLSRVLLSVSCAKLAYGYTDFATCVATMGSIYTNFDAVALKHIKQVCYFSRLALPLPSKKTNAMAEKHDTGRNGETIARRYLENKGYKILAVNWRHHRYELDIVAENANELVIVEVKTRSDNYLLAPEMAIDKRKIRHIVTASDAYVRVNSIELPVRFDVLCLVKKDKCYIIENHIENAFFAPMG